MEKLFGLAARGTTVRTEVLGGLTTFFAMVYIVFVNSGYLAMAGMDATAVMLATCLSAAIGCVLSALIANLPLAQAPGMGLNTFFTFTVCAAMGYTWRQALGIVLVSGVLFLVMMATPFVRTRIMRAVPDDLSRAISAGIGLFIAFAGCQGSGLIRLDPQNAFTTLGPVTQNDVLLAIIGIAITAVLAAYKVQGGIIIGIVATTLIGVPMGVTSLDAGAVSWGLAPLGEVFLKLDLPGLLSLGVLPLMTAILSFLIVSIVDTGSTFLIAAQCPELRGEDGRLRGEGRAFVASALACCVGALMGTSTVVPYAESAGGIEEGARTGLSTLVVGVLFVLCTFLTPIAAIIPPAALAPALIIVGFYMMRGAMAINWNDFEAALPCFLTLIIMPLSYSIPHGIAFGFISFTLIKVLRGKLREVPIALYVLSAAFVALYIFTA